MDPKQPELLSLHEVAAELGVHYMTAYRYVRLGILPARREGRSWKIQRSDLEGFAARDEPRTPRGEADWADRFFGRIIAADEAGAWGVLEAALASGMTILETEPRLLVPTMRRVGELWRTGEVDIATEHAATEVAARITARLGPRLARPGARKGTVVLGSTATELHSLPLAMAANQFRAAQFDVVNLGAYLPADAFAGFVKNADGVVAVGIGVTSPGQETELGETLAAIRAVTAVPVVVGGAGVDESTARGVGADGWAGPASDAVAVVEKLLAAPAADSAGASSMD